MTKTINGIRIECLKGDISNQPDAVAVVNAANAELRTGGGVAGALHKAAGPGLEKECRPLAPIKPGEAVITGAHNLPNRYVIHCLGPVFGKDKPEETLLANCYKNALTLAEEHEIATIAFPSISTGIFGYPAGEAAEVAFSTIINKTETLRSVKTIRFVLFSDKDLEINESVLARLAAS